MRRVFGSRFGALSIATLVVACTAQEDAGPGGDTIQLGFIHSYSGLYEDTLRPNRMATELAVAWINEHGGVLGRPLELVARDDGSVAENTLMAVEELLAGGIRLLYVGQTLGHEAVQTAFAAGALYATASISPHMASIPSSRGLLQTMSARPHLYLETILASVVERGAVLRVLANNSTFASSVCSFAAVRQVDCGWEAFDALVEDWEAYDFRPHLQRLLASRTGPWVLHFLGGTSAGAKALVQLADMAAPEDLPFIHLVGTSIGRDGYLLSTPPAILRKTYSTMVAALENHPTAAPFVRLYQETYGDLPPVGSNNAFELVVILALAIEAAGSLEPEQVAAQIQQISNGGIPVGLLEYERARSLLAAGEDIDIVGFTQPLDRDPGGWLATMNTGAWSIVEDQGQFHWQSRPDRVCSDLELTGQVSCYSYEEFAAP
jgi:branched-chain amino acid transport system substrate-binding protein